jgi:hypothetical protein
MRYACAHATHPKVHNWLKLPDLPNDGIYPREPRDLEEFRQWRRTGIWIRGEAFSPFAHCRRVVSMKTGSGEKAQPLSCPKMLVCCIHVPALLMGNVPWLIAR